MPSHQSIRPLALRGRSTSRLSSVAARLGTVLARAMARRRERRALALLDERLLKDIGVTAADAQREFEKPIWR